METLLKVLSGKALWVFVAAAILLWYWMYRLHGMEGIREAFSQDLPKVAIWLGVISFVFAFVMTPVNYLAKKHPEEVKDLIAGKHGDLKMIAVAMMLPGPAGAEQLKKEWEGGGSNKGKIIVFLTAMMATGITMVMFRGPLLGGQLTLIWMGLSALFVATIYFLSKMMS